ncbi:MAG: hypothetical protein GY799_12275 [Desulfobulbaceae bacterium]|nr:hypothetical protein [Desulfobulbaceae bacterium]
MAVLGWTSGPPFAVPLSDPLGWTSGPIFGAQTNVWFDGEPFIIERPNAEISYNGDDIDIGEIYPIETSITLGLIPMTDSVGNLKYRTITNGIKYSSVINLNAREQRNKLDQYISGENYDATTAQPILTTLDGVYPLSPLFDFTGGQSVSILPENKGKVDFFNKITRYKHKLIPDGSLVASDFTGQTSCTSESWTFNGVGLPYPLAKKFAPKLNGSNRQTQGYGGYTDTVGTARTSGDRSTVTVEVAAVKAFELLTMLTTQDWELGAVAAAFDASYKPFGNHRGDSVNVIIGDSKIGCVQSESGYFKITFTMQLV